MVLGSLLGNYGLERVHWMEYPRGVLTWVILATILFIGVLFGTVYLIDHSPPDYRMTVLAFAPVLPGLLLLSSMAHALARLDELQRRIQVEVSPLGSVFQPWSP